MKQNNRSMQKNGTVFITVLPVIQSLRQMGKSESFPQMEWIHVYVIKAPNKCSVATDLRVFFSYR